MNNLMNAPSPFEKTMGELYIKHPDFGQNGYCLAQYSSAKHLAPAVISESEFYAAVDFLRLVGELIRNPVSSYKLKHIAEKTQKTYISNGAMIAAAYYLGFSVRRIKDSSNATIRLPEYRTLH